MISTVDTVDSLVQRNKLVREMTLVEPELLLILKMAALNAECENRWHLYEKLKRQGVILVGWYARMPEIQTARHYMAFINALDELLPEERDIE